MGYEFRNLTSFIVDDTPLPCVHSKKSSRSSAFYRLPHPIRAALIDFWEVEGRIHCGVSLSMLSQLGELLYLVAGGRNPIVPHESHVYIGVLRHVPGAVAGNSIDQRNTAFYWM